MPTEPAIDNVSDSNVLAATLPLCDGARALAVDGAAAARCLQSLWKAAWTRRACRRKP
ncbi:hypothetical protein I553_0082 [Mycobacterium xenopi 4042]|uniref:Uncharacterized protein n=1 Tax=Mycobacterium xenopi 4042 TaxID=1299334 RepID=X7YJW3_MYCXE|nr:hypothetical protein I553_0082 [Mycobacterium xenopi 4042]